MEEPEKKWKRTLLGYLETCQVFILYFLYKKEKDTSSSWHIFSYFKTKENKQQQQKAVEVMAHAFV